MPARFRILPSGRPAAHGAPAGAAGPLVEREVELADARRRPRRSPRRSRAAAAVPRAVRRARAAAPRGRRLVGRGRGEHERDVARRRAAARPASAGRSGGAPSCASANVRLRFEGDGAPTRRRRGDGHNRAPARRRSLRRAPTRARPRSASCAARRRAACGSPCSVVPTSWGARRAARCRCPSRRSRASTRSSSRGAEGVVLRDLGSKNGVLGRRRARRGPAAPRRRRPPRDRPRHARLRRPRRPLPPPARRRRARTASRRSPPPRRPRRRIAPSPIRRPRRPSRSPPSRRRHAPPRARRRRGSLLLLPRRRCSPRSARDSRRALSRAPRALLALARPSCAPCARPCACASPWRGRRCASGAWKPPRSGDGVFIMLRQLVHVHARRASSSARTA